ncbi:MAG: putative toxin-antitoxin system toxin component, PIN family [Candidatus Andersenbacteria bacterium]
MKKSKPRVVVDTNVIVSALNFGGNPARIVTMAGLKMVELFLSDQILQESAGVLQEKFAWTSGRVSRAVQAMKDIAVVVKPTERVVVVRDKDDDHLLECAVAAHAHYLVSGDEDLLVLKRYRDTKIVSPAQFLKILHKAR